MSSTYLHVRSSLEVELFLYSPYVPAQNVLGGRVPSQWPVGNVRVYILVIIHSRLLRCSGEWQLYRMKSLYPLGRSVRAAVVSDITKGKLSTST